MRRTLSIATEYQGNYDATLLINCLLGLLIVPKESLLQKIPETPFESLSDWGISPDSIKAFGRYRNGYSGKPNLRQLVHRLRNATAHFRIDPVHQEGQVSGFSFKDRNGFHAQISLPEIQTLVVRLADHLEHSI